MATRLEHQFHQWHNEMYGDGPVNLAATYRKLCEEVGELGEAIMQCFSVPDGEPVRQAKIAACIEAADVAILCLMCIRGIEGSSSASLSAWMAVKMEKLEEKLREKKGTT